MEFSAIGPRGWVEFAPCIAIKKEGMTELGGGSRCPLQVQSYLFSFYILTLTLLTLTLIITLTLTLTQARPNHNRRRKGRRASQNSSVEKREAELLLSLLLRLKPTVSVAKPSQQPQQNASMKILETCVVSVQLTSRKYNIYYTPD